MVKFIYKLVHDTQSAQHAQSKEHNTYIVTSRRQSIASILITTMTLWRHTGYERSVYYALCFVHVEHSVCHEPISVLINIFMFLS